MASIRKFLSSSSSSAVKLCKSSGSSYRAPIAGGSTGAQCPVSQSFGPKVKNSSCTSVPSPFCHKCNIPGSIPGRRLYTSHIARLPGEVAALQSLLPYYSAIADSRLVSRLGASGEASILQGTLTHMSPDL